jgi:hypothetical protein
VASNEINDLAAHIVTSRSLVEVSMTEEQLEALRKARDALVKSRREWARVLASGYQPGKTEDAIKRIAEIQAAVKAVDDALEDEGALLTQRR